MISQTGLGHAIGLAARGHSIRQFANGQVMAGFVGTEILEKLENPLKFQYRPAGTENLVIEAHGYDVTLLIGRGRKGAPHPPGAGSGCRENLKNQRAIRGKYRHAVR